MGLDRLILMILIDSYDEEKINNNEMRIVMHIKPSFVPYKAVILSLSKQLNTKAKEIFNFLCNDISCTYDENDNIRKRCRRGDEIGIPYAIPIDFDTLNDDCVTNHFRDSMN